MLAIRGRSLGAGLSTAIVSALVVGGISGAAQNHKKPPHHAPTAITRSAAAKQYLALVAPANAAIAKFDAQAKTWSDSTSDIQAEVAAKPVIAVLGTLGRGLVNDRWPKAAAADIKGVATAIAPMTGDLEGLANINVFSASSWISTFRPRPQLLGHRGRNRPP